MLYAKPKKEALAIHERAVNKYNTQYQKMEKLGIQLYERRQDSVSLIHEIEFLVNSIANRPKEFEKKISDIQAAREKFRETEAYAAEAIEAAVKSGAAVAASPGWPEGLRWPAWHQRRPCGLQQPLELPLPELRYLL